MDEIIPGLFVSNWETSRDISLLRSNNITGVITIETRAKEGSVIDNYRKVGIDLLYIPLQDSPNADMYSCFDATASFIDRHLRRGKSVLVHCWAGISRSVTVALNYYLRELVRTHDTTGVPPAFIVKNALANVRRRRPIANPNSGFVRQLEYRTSEYKHAFGGGFRRSSAPSECKYMERYTCALCRY